MTSNKIACPNCQTHNTSSAENCYFCGKILTHSEIEYDELNPYRAHWKSDFDVREQRYSFPKIGSVIGGLSGLVVLPVVFFYFNPAWLTPASLNAINNDGFAAVYVPLFFAVCAGCGAFVGGAVQLFISEVQRHNST